MLAAAAGASTALSSLAATAGGGEAALLPRFGAEVAGGLGPAAVIVGPWLGGGNRGTGAHLTSAQASPQLDRCQLHRGFNEQHQKAHKR